MKLYIVSRSGNSHFALEPDNILAVFGNPLNPSKAEREAIRFADEHTEACEENTFLHWADMGMVGTFKIKKGVVFVPAE